MPFFFGFLGLFLETGLQGQPKQLASLAQDDAFRLIQNMTMRRSTTGTSQFAQQKHCLFGYQGFRLTVHGQLLAFHDVPPWRAKDKTSTIRYQPRPNIRYCTHRKVLPCFSVALPSKKEDSDR